MKEVTYEDWQKNPTPRMMWVWDSESGKKIQRKVICMLEPNVLYPVFALSDDAKSTDLFRHCAEIKKSRRMTYKELSRWLRENPTREYKYITGSYIYASFDYREKNQNVEVHESTRIRENDGEWREPLVEIEE